MCTYKNKISMRTVSADNIFNQLLTGNKILKFIKRCKSC